MEYPQKSDAGQGVEDEVVPLDVGMKENVVPRNAAEDDPEALMNGDRKSFGVSKKIFTVKM